MMISSYRASHGIIANAPATLAVHASAPILAQRTFQGSGAPSSSTLIPGNGRYCAGNGGWVIDGAIYGAGANYVVGDVLMVGGGTHSVATQFTVDMVSATGGILDFHCTTVGVYSVYPNSVVSATGGTGTGAEFNVAQQPADMYWDYTNTTLYVCTTPGSYSSSVWSQVSGGAIQQFKLVATGTKDAGDYYNCNTWDGTTLGGSVVKVAKQYKMRCLNGPASESIRGAAKAYTYSYNSTYDEYQRSTNSGASTDFPTPPALASDIIIAAAFTTTSPSTLVGVQWIELTERKWASQ